MVDLTAVLNEDDDRLRGATIYDVQNELRRLKVLPHRLFWWRDCEGRANALGLTPHA
jgi:hypothetical protein